MSNQKWEKERPLLSDYRKQSNGGLLLSTVFVRSGRKGCRWLAFGMFWLCLGGMGEMPLPSSVFGSPLQLLPAIDKFPSMLIGPPTVLTSFLKSSHTHHRESPVPGKAQVQNTARSPTTLPLMAQEASEKEKDVPVIREPQEKEKVSSGEAEAVEKDQVPAVAPETQEKEHISPVEREAQEKGPPVIREAQEKEKTSSGEAEALEKDQVSPVVPEAKEHEHISPGEGEVQKKEKAPPVIREAQEKEKTSSGEAEDLERETTSSGTTEPAEKDQVSPVAPEGQEPEGQEMKKTSPIEFEEMEKEKTSPVLVPGVPEKAPPILVPEAPENGNGPAIKSYKTKIQETRDLIRTIDEGRLTGEQHDTFNSIHSFLEKSREAFSQDDMSMAVNLAEKAHTLAKEIVRNSSQE